MLHNGRIFGMLIVVCGLTGVFVAQNAIGQSGTRGGIGGGGSGQARGGGGGGGGGTGPSIDPLALAFDLIVANQLADGTSSGERPNDPTLEAQLAQYLRAAQYQNWAPFPGQRDDFVKGQGPHGPFVKTYVNRPVASDPKKPGYGSILLQENYSKDKKQLVDVTVMCRIQGFDPDHDDWYWAQYKPDGSVTRNGQEKLAGQVASCINCHARAKANDFLYSNDK